jgi:benzylsuccinate CoA-transferase BbsF subunit
LIKQANSTKSALDNVRVFSLAETLAGGMPQTVLALMGAEIIKVEYRRRLDRADALRPWQFWMPAPLLASGVNKLAITLDVANPEGLELAKRLVKISHVVTTSMRPGVMDRLGLGYSALKEIKPDIIMFASSGHGQKGPEKLYGGYAGIYSVLSGLAEMVGYSDSPPTDTRSSADIRAGLYGAVAILAALNHWQKTGEGQFIDFSQREANITAVADAIMDYTMNGRNQTRSGNRSPVMAPHNCYHCRGEDRWISIAVANDEEWQALCGVVKNPVLIKDSRFADQESRWQNQAELDQIINEWTKDYDSIELMGILQNAGVAAMPSFNSKDLCEDPHLKERLAFATVANSKIGQYQVLAPVWRLSETPPQAKRGFPEVGEDNKYVFGTLLGLSDKEIADLTDKGVI